VFVVAFVAATTLGARKASLVAFAIVFRTHRLFALAALAGQSYSLSNGGSEKSRRISVERGTNGVVSCILEHFCVEIVAVVALTVIATEYLLCKALTIELQTLGLLTVATLHTTVATASLGFGLGRSSCLRSSDYRHRGCHRGC
jgi:hypothetical protein